MFFEDNANIFESKIRTWSPESPKLQQGLCTVILNVDEEEEENVLGVFFILTFVQTAPQNRFSRFFPDLLQNYLPHEPKLWHKYNTRVPYLLLLKNVS